MDRLLARYRRLRWALWAFLRGWWLGQRLHLRWRIRLKIIRCYRVGMSRDAIVRIALRACEEQLVERFGVPEQHVSVPTSSAIDITYPDQPGVYYVVQPGEWRASEHW